MPRPVELPTPRLHPREVLGQIHGERADQPDREHLRLERTGELRPIGDVIAIRHAELAVAVHRRRAHQIAYRLDLLRVWLNARGQALHHVLEQAHALVRAGEHQLSFRTAPGFLQRHVRRQALEIRLTRLAVHQGERRIPALCDHAVRAFLRCKAMAETDQAVGRRRPPGPVDGGALTVGIDAPDRAVDRPSLPIEAA
jgi:hypothetical protein